MQLLAVLKPDGVLRKASGAGILKGLKESKLCEFSSFTRVTVPKQLLDEHYKHVRNRDFYPWLVRYMSSYASYVMLLNTDSENISKLRKLLGATRVHEAEEDSLRYKFCPYGGANGLHMSESEDAGKFEVSLWEKVLGPLDGKFDIPIDEYINLNLDNPNYTFELRKILLDIATGRATLNRKEKEIKELLSLESVNGTAEQINFLYWVLTDALK